MSERLIMIPCPGCGVAFRVVERLAPGVYGAACCSRVAIKVRTLSELGSWDAHERVAKAAKWLQETAHRGFARVLAFDASGFVVTERLDETLLARVSRGAPALDERALLRQLLEPLACMHRAGLAHGDVTPQSVMFRGDVAVLTSAGAFASDGNQADDVRAAAEAVLFARTDRVRVRGADRHTELGPLLRAMLDVRSRPKDAVDALRMLDGAPVPGVLRTKLAAVSCAVFAMLLLGAFHSSRVPPADPPIGPDRCRITSEPPGAAIFLGDREVPWDASHPLEHAIGATPLAVERDARRPIILHRHGYRPFILELSAGEGACAFTAKLTPE